MDKNTQHFTQFKDFTQFKEWHEYYDRFDYFSPNLIREGCYPRFLQKKGKQKNAIVLVHGLTDAPYFMQAIGDYFYEKMGFNVYIPLLHKHGLKKPNGMRGVSLNEWKYNVEFAIQVAGQHADTISIGGLSTGGALSAYMSLIHPLMNGATFLFSAALDIAGQTGDFKEWLLRTPIANVVDFVQDTLQPDLIGENPYRYARIDIGGAQQLAKLIKSMDKIIKHKHKQKAIHKPYFAAHSADDTQADIKNIEKFLNNMNTNKTQLFKIGKDFRVPHASVVLKHNVCSGSGSPLEPKNPFFDEMMAAVHAFAQQHLTL